MTNLGQGIEVRIDFFGYTLGVGIIQTIDINLDLDSRDLFFIPDSLF